MQYQFQNNKKALLLLFLILFLSGCSLKSIDQKLGEVFFDEENVNVVVEKEEEDLKNMVDDKLTPEIKEKIDNWLKASSLNRYGDKADTYYTGGTPLFDETTGKAIERFEYILEKIPDILEKI